MAIEKVIVQNFKNLKNHLKLALTKISTFWLGITNLGNLPFSKLFMWL